MTKYSMDGAEDLQRLEKQNEQKTYDLKKDLKHFSFEKGDKILDAGCGTGLVTRAIHDEFSNLKMDYYACDISEIALKTAHDNFIKYGIKSKTFVSELESIDLESNTMDKVITRYVLEHMPNPQLGVNEFFRILKPGGTAQIIDLDGILFNMFSTNQKLNRYLDLLRQGFNFDLFVGRKIPALLKNAGFTNINWNADIMAFNTSVELGMEINNYESRFHLAKPVIEKVLGSESIFKEFVELYLNELKEPTNTLFYNKFFVTGIKPKN